MKLSLRRLLCKQTRRGKINTEGENAGGWEAGDRHVEATGLFSLVMFENVHNNDCFEKKQHLIVSTLDQHCIAHPGSWPGFCPSDPGRKKCWRGIAKPWVFRSFSSHHCLAPTASRHGQPSFPVPEIMQAAEVGHTPQGHPAW